MKTIEETIKIINNRIVATHNSSVTFYQLSKNEHDEERKKTYEDISFRYSEISFELIRLLETIKN